VSLVECGGKLVQCVGHELFEFVGVHDVPSNQRVVRGSFAA
jgi:hypothetical protein